MSDFASLLSARGHGLVLPRSDEDQINRYVGMHSAERGSVEQRPFGRQVDFWALSIAAALAMELEPREGPASGWARCSSTRHRGSWTTISALCSPSSRSQRSDTSILKWTSPDELWMWQTDLLAPGVRSY